MLRVFISALVVYINFISQTTLLQNIAIRGVIPNTMVLLIVSMALLRGQVEGAAIGFFAGMLQDIFFGSAIGYFALLGLLIGVFAGAFAENFYRENYVLPIVISIISTFLYETMQYVTFYLFRGYTNFGYFLSVKIIPQVIYTTLFVFFVYRILYAANNFVENRERY